MPAFLDPSKPGQVKDYAFSEFPQCPGHHPVPGGPAVGGPGNYWHTDAGCQSIFRENIGFFGFSVRRLSHPYTCVRATCCISIASSNTAHHLAERREWHPWNGDALKADWTTMTGELAGTERFLSFTVHRAL